MCLSKGIFVSICLLLTVLGGLFVSLSVTTRVYRELLILVGSGAMTLGITGISVLQNDIACTAGTLF